MFFTYTYFIVFTGTFLIGITAGVVGVFLYYRRESLAGDVLGHAALSGIIFTYLLILTKNHNLLLIGATISGLMAFFLYRFIYRNTIIDRDTALGSSLAIFSGLGITLLTYVQKIPNSSKAGLWNYIFGNAANMLNQDVYLIAIVSCIIFIIIAFFYKEFKTITFDQNFAETLNLPIKRLNVLLSFMIGATIMIGIQTIGIILISSLLVAPVVTTKLWCRSFFKVMLFSGLVGGIYCFLGTSLNIFYSTIPIGPIIVLIASFGFLVSLILSIIIGNKKILQTKS